LLIFAIVLASIAVGILLLKILLEFWALYGSFPKRLAGFRTRYWTLLSKTITNLILLLYGVWVTWCIFQFSISDSWAVKILAAVTLSVFTAILAAFAIRIVILARRYKRMDGDTSALYENKETWEKYSVFYDSYKKSKWWIFMPVIFVSFCRGAILAGGNGHGLVQTTAQLAVETITFLFLLWNRPFATAAGNWINITIQVVRVLSFVCVLVFVEQLGIAQTTKTITGVVLIVVQGVLTTLLVILIAVNGLIVMCKENPHRKRQKEAGTILPLSSNDSSTNWRRKTP
jgi:Transient receptor potential (TRP) ion channel